MSNTPMKATKHYIDQILNLIAGRFDVLRLNRSSPKYNPHRYDTFCSGYSLGVNSDHIVIFKDKVDHSSFGIVFNYLGRKKENWTFQFTYKKLDLPCLRNRLSSSLHQYDDDEARKELNKTIRYSREYHITEVKSVFKDLIAVICSSSSNDDVFDFIIALTEPSDSDLNIDFDAKLEQAKTDIGLALEHDISNIVSIEGKFKEKNSKLEKRRIELEEKTYNHDLYKQIEALEKQLKELKSQFSQITDNFALTQVVDDLDKQVTTLGKDLYSRKTRLSYSVKAQIEKQPFYLRQHLMDYFSKHLNDNY